MIYQKYKAENKMEVVKGFHLIAHPSHILCPVCLPSHSYAVSVTFLIIQEYITYSFLLSLSCCISLSRCGITSSNFGWYCLALEPLSVLLWLCDFYPHFLLQIQKDQPIPGQRVIEDICSKHAGVWNKNELLTSSIQVHQASTSHHNFPM